MKTVMIQEFFNGVSFSYKKTANPHAKPGRNAIGIFYKIENIPKDTDIKNVEEAISKTTIIDRNFNKFELSYKDVLLNKNI